MDAAPEPSTGDDDTDARGLTDAQRVVWLIRRGRAAEARGVAEKLVTTHPQSAVAHHLLGASLRATGDNAPAAVAFARAVELKPDYALAHGNLGKTLADLDRLEEAERHLERAIAGGADTPLNRVRLATLVPAINDSVEAIDRRRELLAQRMTALRDDAGGRGSAGVDLSAVEAWPMFYLAYHGRNDRALCELAATLYQPPPPIPHPQPRRASGGRKVRLGIVSAHFRDHTIGRLNRGLVARLPRERLHVTAVSLGDHRDDLARAIAAAADEWVALPADGVTARRPLTEAAFDVLLYTGIGMEAATYTLAFSRLAPVQCATWGHPSTTGLPATIDYFLSSELLETPDADGHYSEKLVRLPNLAISYDRPAFAPPADSDTFGLPRGRTLYGCLQTLPKLHPDFDALAAGVLRADPAGLLVLIDTHPRLDWRGRLIRRFARTMPDVLERVCFLPLMSRESYLRLVGAVHVLLDPPHFGGGNTTFEAFAAGTPVVTLPSAFLKGRITLALCGIAGVGDELAASSPADYVRRATEIARDDARRRRLRERLLAAGPALFENDAGARDLAAFIASAAGSAGSE